MKIITFNVLNRKALALILSITILLVIIVTIASYLSLKRVVDKKDAAAFLASEKMIDVEKLKVFADEKIAHTRGYLLTGNQEMLENVLISRGDFYEVYGKLKLEINNQKEIEYLEKVEKIETEHQKNLQKIINLKNNKSELTEIIRAFNNFLLPIRIKLKDAITDFGNYQKKLLDDARTQSILESNRAESLFILSSAVLILFMIAVSFLIFRSYSSLVTAEERFNSLGKENEKNFQKFIDLVNHLDHSVVWEAILEPFNIVFMSERSQLLFGLPSKEVQQNPELFFNYIYPDDLLEVKELFKKAQSDVRDHRCDHRMFNAEGGYRWVQTGVHCKLDRDGKKKLFGITVDITPLKKVELELASALKGVSDYKQALDTSSIVAVTDPNGTITYVNEKFCEISKYGQEELLGKNHKILNSGYHSKTFFRDLYKTITSGRTWRGEIKNRAKDGSLYWVDTVIVPFLENGKPTKYVAIINDITMRKKIEEEKSQLIENLEKERDARLKFVSTLTHDLRTPLTSSLMSAEIIKRQSENQGKVKEMALKVIKNIKRTDEMIQDLLDSDRVRAGQPLPVKFEKFELIDQIKTILQDMSETHANRFLLQGLKEVYVTWDARGIRRMIENLLNNAIKYGISDHPILINIKKEGHFIDLEVINDAEEISQDELDQMFSHFTRSPSAVSSGIKGWGIGLTIVKGIAEAHKGHVRVMNRSGKTIFIVSLRPDPTVPDLESERSFFQH